MLRTQATALSTITTAAAAAQNGMCVTVSAEELSDGYDFINAPGVCSVEQSWAWRNGWVPDTDTGAGNGAGFKAGGFGLD